MTAVRGPFVFTSDQFRDDFVSKASSAGCGALALQLGKHPGDAPAKVRAAGLQIIGWGISSGDTTETAFLIGASGAGVWMPQAESTPEFEALIACLNKGIPHGLPTEPVMTSGGMEPPGNPTDAEKLAERRRRINLLNSFGITKVWVEVYKQDADRSGQALLGSVDYMCHFFKNAYGFAEAHPVLGLWTVDDSQAWAQNPYSVSNYDLERHGRTFGAWRAEQMADARYPEIAAVPPLVPPPPPPPPPSTKYTTAQARSDIAAIAQRWASDNPTQNLPHTRIALAGRIADPPPAAVPDKQWRPVGEQLAAVLEEAEA